MKTLFDKTELSGIQLKNRFIRAATWENMADGQGHLTAKLIKLYKDLSKGGVGLIITGYARVMKGEQPNSGMMGIYDDSFVEEYKKLTEMVHKNGCKIVLQIAYGGSNTNYKVKEREIWGPSAVAHQVYGTVPNEMTKENFKSLGNAFASAAERAKASGFDGVEYHASHGYLLSQFLTPYYNRRIDGYGGAIENRARIVYEIYRQTRDRVGSNFPLIIKLHCSDFMEQGFTFEESKIVCQELAKRGIDAIEISGGNFSSSPEVSPVRKNIKSPEKESYFRQYAAKIAKIVNVPIILVGGNKSFEVMADILSNSEIEYFSLSRPLLSEPDLINKWKIDTHARARCRSCNKCWDDNGNICIIDRDKTGKKNKKRHRRLYAAIGNTLSI
jgi:2,4-dienoyl-CoA reductase-like NADH-dependent reductase (Old Yellow Enzyme family)